MSYLVTGGGGFIGRAVTRALIERGADVRMLARDGSHSSAMARQLDIPELVYAELGQVSELVSRMEPEVVVHLAAQQTRAPRGAAQIGALLEANVHLGALLLEGVRDSGAVVVQAMSYSQFRDGRPALTSFYAATKESLRSIGAFYREVAGVDVRDVVLYDNYGPDDSRDKLVPYLVTALETDAVATVGPVEQSVNLLQVDDVAAGLIAAGDRGAPPTMTVRAAEPTTVGGIISALETVSGRRLQWQVDPDRRVSDAPLRAGDWPTPPGWSPRIPLEVGLAQLLRAGSSDG